MIRRTLTQMRDFLRDTRGNASIEIAIFGPMLLFMLAAAYVYFDAYRQKTVNTNAAYTISDAFSRQTDAIDPLYMDGMHAMLEFLTETDVQTGLRVTVARWDETDLKYYTDWSETRGPLYPLTNRDLNTTLVNNLPTLLHNERVIVVETSSAYKPPMNIPGLTEQELYNFAFTRPRFAPQLVWSDGGSSGV